MFAWASRLFALLGLLLAGYAVYGLRQGERQADDREPTLELQWPPDLSVAGPGGQELIVRVSNTSATPQTIVGMSEVCGPTVCCRCAHARRVPVPPGQTVDYPFVIDVREPGPFELPLALLIATEDAVRQETHTLRGVVADPAPGSAREE